MLARVKVRRAERIKHGVRTIRERLKDTALLEGIHDEVYFHQPLTQAARRL